MRANVFYISIFIVFVLLFSCCTQPESKNEIIPETSVHTSETPHNTIQNIELVTKLSGNLSVICSMDTYGNYIAAGADNGKLMIWNQETLDAVQSNHDNRMAIEELMILDDDVYTLGDDDVIRKIDIQTGSSSVLLEMRNKAFDIDEASNLMMVSIDEEKMVLLDLTTMEEIKSIILTDGCFDLRFSNDGKYLYSVGHNGKMQKWSLEDASVIYEYKGLYTDVHSLELTSDEKYLVAGGTDQITGVWDVGTGELIAKYSHSYGIFDIAISGNDQYIASADGKGEVVVYDLKQGKLLKRLKHKNGIHNVEFDNKVERIFAGSDDGCVYVWNISYIE